MAKPLFLPAIDPHSFFEKEASISKMPDDEKNWPAHILSMLHEQLPFLSNFSVNIMIQRMEPEAGFAFGYAIVLGKSDPRVSTESKNVENSIRIPIIVADRQLQPFHTFEINNQVMPLTPDRVEAAMMNPAMFDGPATRPATQKSLVDQLYPPYQQRQGFGLTNTGTNAGGISKVSAAPSEDMTPAQLRRLATLKATAKQDAAARSMTKSEALEGSLRRAALPTAIGSLAGAVKGGVSGFRGSSGDIKARLLQTAGGAGIGAVRGGGFVGGVSAANEALQRSARVKRDLDRQKMGIKVSSAETVKEANVPAPDAIDRLSGAGSGSASGSILGALGGSLIGGLATKSLSGARTGAIIGGGAGGAIGLAGGAIGAKSRSHRANQLANRLKERRGLPTKVASASGHVKEALARLDFNPSRRIPSSMVMKGSKVRVMPGVTPMSIHFFPIMGTKFVVGVDAKLAKKLGKMKDQNEIKRAIIGPMKAEIRAARAKRPSPGMFMLFVKGKKGYSYQTPSPIPGMAV